MSLNFHPVPNEDQLLASVLPQDLSLDYSFGHVSCSWIPTKDIRVTIPACISSTFDYIPIQINSLEEILELKISLLQNERLNFKYNVDPSRPYGQDSLKTLKMKEKKEVLTLYTSVFENISDSGTHWISHSEPLTKSWDIFLEDLDVILLL